MRIIKKPQRLLKIDFYLNLKQLLVLAVLLFLVNYLVSLGYKIYDVNFYLTFHLLAEFFSVIISFMVAIAAWYNLRETNDLRELVICLLFIAVGAIDFVHALSYNGMPAFFTNNSVNKASTFWVLARLVAGLGFLFIASSRQKKAITRKFSFLAVIATIILVFSATLAVSRFLSDLPPMFIDSVGQTAEKIFAEYFIILLNFLAIVSIYRQRKNELGFGCFSLALFFSIFSELNFTFYSDAYDSFNLLGHIYKVLAYLLILQYLFTTSWSRLIQKNNLLEKQRKKLAIYNMELRQANQLKDEFLANTSHELRTPLTAIIAFSELLLDSKTGHLNDCQQDYLEEIQKSGYRLLKSINDILEIKKIEAGKISLNLEHINAVAIIQEVVDQIQSLFRQKGIVFIAQINSDQIVGQFDKEKLKQILINVLGNALKFTDSGGQVSLVVSTDPAVKILRIEVIDSGIGIPAKEIPFIFNKFYMVNGSNRKKYQGTGLGLSIVKKHLDLLHGTIEVQNLNQENKKGTAFIIELPLKLNG